MRQGIALFCASLVLAVFGIAPVLAGDVEVKGPHLCCGQCVKVAKGLLAKVDGVSDANANAKTKTVTFKAKDQAAAQAGLKALFDGGFFGAATSDGQELKIEVPAAAKGDKADVVVVKDVHVCCGQCKKGVNGLFKDAKVSYEGTGPQLTVRIEGTSLDRGEVLEALRKAGFNGSVQK